MMMQYLFEEPWEHCDVTFIRMEYSLSMDRVGKLGAGKLFHLLALIARTWWARIKKRKPYLYYPPASPNAVPLLRDIVFLFCTRWLFAGTIYHFHSGGVGEYISGRGFLKRLGRLAYGRPFLSVRLADCGISPSEVLRAHHDTIIHNGVPVPDPGERAPRTDPRTILYLGSLRKGKGVLEIIKTAAILKQRGRDDLLFQLAGDWVSDEFREETHSLVRELGVEDSVEFLGVIKGEEKWKVIRESSLFFFPTRYDSEFFPLVLIEALGSGVPVLTTKWRGIPELLDGCEAGEALGIPEDVVYADKVESWIERIAKDSDQIISRAARSFYEERYTVERFRKKVEGDFIEALQLEDSGPQLSRLSPAAPPSREADLDDSGPVTTSDTPAHAAAAVKRYLLVSPKPPPFHGQTYAVHLLLRGFPRENVEIVHLDSRFGADLSGLRKASFKKAFLLIKYVFKLFALRFRHRFDGVILTPSFYGIPFFKDSILAWSARLLFYRRLIAWLHMDFGALQYEKLGWFRRRYVRRTLRNFDNIVCVAPRLIDNLPDFVDHGRAAAVLNGVPPFPQNAGEKPDGVFRVIYLSDMTPMKGWDVLLEASREACSANEKIEVLFFGRASGTQSESEVEEAFEKAGNERIRYMGEMDAERKKRALHSAHMFCFPSLNEACPLAVIEAMAAGLPILASDVGGVGDLLVDGKGGKLIPAGSAGILSEALLEYSRMEPGVLQSMGDFNARRFEETFTDEAYAERWARYLRDLS